MSSTFQKAADAVACNMLADIGQAGTQLAVWTMWTPKAALVPLTVGALSYLANELFCPDMPGPPINNDSLIDGCKKGQEGWEGNIHFKRQDGSIGTAYGTVNEMVQPTYEREFNGKWGMRWECLRANGLTSFVNTPVADTQEELAGVTYWLDGPDLECQIDNDPKNPGNPRPDTPEYEYIDIETNCDYTLKLEGFVQQYEGGPAQPVYQIKSNTAARSDGGRMGGCNLSPTIFIHNGGGNGGGGGGGPHIPIPTPLPPDGDDGVPWWLKALIGATTGALLNQLADMLAKSLEPPLAKGGFTLVAPCNYDSKGQNAQVEWTWEPEPLINRIHTHQVVMMEMMQQHLNWKTPTCGDAKPVLEGDWRTISFRSEETSPYGKSRLRKRFRYRSTSGLGLAQVVDHWAGFTFAAGPVCVQHSGASWGTPQVWASTADEGKRVIRHAAGEAGIDPDQVGRWTISGSNSARVGVSGAMKVDTTGGYYWITARDGSDSRPIVAKT